MFKLRGEAYATMYESFGMTSCWPPTPPRPNFELKGRRKLAANAELQDPCCRGLNTWDGIWGTS